MDYSNLPQNDCFVITNDVLSSEFKASPEQLAQIKKDGFTQHFKLYDDDGILYYSGYYKETKWSTGFEPLDDYAMPNAGCTYIKYRNPKTSKYEML